MEYYANQNDYRSYLQHFGIQGMKWGVRRYQNSDGSLTPAGRKRYGRAERKAEKKQFKKDYKEYKRIQDKVRSETYDKLYEENGAAELEKKLYSKRYDPHNYESGKGRDKVRRERYELDEEYTRLADKAYDDSYKYAKLELEKKYGKERLSEFEAREMREGQIAAVTALAAIGSLVYMNKRIRALP